MNYSTIEDLGWAIEAGQGEFSLTFAHCNYVKWREELIQQLQGQCEIARLQLEPGDINLYQKIQDNIQPETPSALMVVGLETVEKLPQLLTNTNNLREKFRADFKFTLVFWVTDFVLGQFTEFAMDFKTFGGTVYLPITPDAVQKDLADKIHQFVDIVLQIGGSQFVPNQKILGQNYQQEIDADLADIKEFGQELNPYTQGCLALIQGRDEYGHHNIDAALTHYQETQELWQGCSEVSPLQQAVLEFHIGLCLEDKSETEARETAKTHFKTCIEILESQNRPDLVAKFINNLGEVLLKLEDWSELKALAEKAIQLHQQYQQSVELSQVYGFLAQVALKEKKWQLACENANLGLEVIKNNPPQPILLRREKYKAPLIKGGLGGSDLEPKAGSPLSPPFKRGETGLLYLLLAQGEEQLGNHKTSWHTYQKGINLELDGKPDYFLQLLQEIRDLYFQHGHYLEAYQAKIEIQARKQQYGLTAFVGAGRLKASKTQDVAVFCRQRDVEKIVEKIARKDNKLTILYGESGVGKSSLVEAGLVSALKRRKLIDNRDIVVANLRVYTNWEDELLEKLSPKAPLFKGGLGGSEPETKTESPLSKGGLRGVLQDHDQNYRFTVLIFDQFEEFFFVVKDATERRRFFEFIVECLNQAYVKVVLSLREDYLHLILQGTRRLDLNAINNDVLDKNILYYIGNFDSDEAVEVIQSLTQNSQFTLEDELIQQLVTDLANFGEVRPIELQIVGAQLQEQGITTLEAYQQLGDQAKNKLVEQYLQDVIEGCGIEENKEIAQYVLSLLIDEKNNTRPLKTKSEIEADLTKLLESLSSLAAKQKLDLVLKVLIWSGLVVLLPEQPADRYQLVHDYLVDVIRQQGEGSLWAQLQAAKAERDQAKQDLVKFLKQAVAWLIVGILGLAGLTGLAIQSAKEANNQTKIAQQQKQEAENQKQEAQRRTEQVIELLSQLASQDYGSNQSSLNPLINALKAGITLEKASANIQGSYRNLVFSTLEKTIYGEKIKERNRLVGHQGSVLSLAFSLNSDTIASGSDDGTIKLWSREGKLLHTLEGHQDSVLSVAFSPDGQTIASGGDDNTIKLWNLQGELLQTLKGHQNWVWAVAFSPDGQTIASGSWDGTIKLWSQKGELLTTLTGHQGSVLSVVFDSDGQTIASGDEDGTIKLWNVESGKLRRTLDADSDAIWTVAFDPDSQNIACGSKDGTIKLWNVKSGELLIALKGEEGNQGSVLSLAFSPNGQTIASGSDDGTIKLWTRQGTLLHTLNGHQSWVNIVAFSPDGETIASGSADNTIKLWGFQEQPQPSLVYKQSLVGNHLNSVLSVVFSPKGQTIASGSKDGTIKLWSRERTALHTFEGHQGVVYTLAFSPDGQIIASGSEDRTIKLWNVESGELLKTWDSDQNWIFTVAFSLDGQTLASGSADKTIKLWNREGTWLRTLEDHQGSVLSVIFSPDRQTLASGSADNTIKLWNVESGELLHTLEVEGHTDWVYSVAFSPDGETLASGSRDGTIKLWNVESGELLPTVLEQPDDVNTVAFSPDGRAIAAGLGDATGDGEGKIIIWNQDLNQELDNLLEQGCDWASDYLTYSAEVRESDRTLCDGVGQ